MGYRFCVVDVGDVGVYENQFKSGYVKILLPHHKLKQQWLDKQSYRFQHSRKMIKSTLTIGEHLKTILLL